MARTGFRHADAVRPEDRLATVIRRRVEDQSPTVIGLAFVAGVILGGLIGANSIGRQVYLPPNTTVS